MDSEIAKLTIEDFGTQWRTYQGNEGFYGSLELFKDITSPFIQTDDVRGKRVVDIGSGAGRIVNMILDAGAAHVTAVEPSKGFEVLKRNIKDPSKVLALNIAGDELPGTNEYDLAFSIGVLHHIPEPDCVVKAVHRALKPGGRFIIWLYGREGNSAYLALVQPVRMITMRLPHFLLMALVRVIDFFLKGYMVLCRFLPLPLKDYLVSVLAKVSPEMRRVTIYDQLNPHHAEYYTREQAISLLERNGYSKVRAHHRRGYSWTVEGTKV